MTLATLRPELDPPLVSVQGLGKRFGALTALLDIHAGEVLALLGDNGAGKSTFVKVLAGAHPATSGEMRIAGRPVSFASPQDAANAGIATIFQELALSENLSIAENVFLGRELVTRVAGLPFLRRRAMKTRVTALLAELDAHIADPDAPVGSLSGGKGRRLQSAVPSTSTRGSSSWTSRLRPSP